MAVAVYDLTPFRRAAALQSAAPAAVAVYLALLIYLLGLGLGLFPEMRFGLGVWFALCLVVFPVLGVYAGRGSEAAIVAFTVVALLVAIYGSVTPALRLCGLPEAFCWSAAAEAAIYKWAMWIAVILGLIACLGSRWQARLVADAPELRDAVSYQRRETLLRRLRKDPYANQMARLFGAAVIALYLLGVIWIPLAATLLPDLDGRFGAMIYLAPWCGAALVAYFGFAARLKHGITADSVDATHGSPVFLRSFADDDVALVPGEFSSLWFSAERVVVESFGHVDRLTALGYGSLDTHGFVDFRTADEAVWQDHISAMLRDAPYLVVIAGKGEGFRWECEQLAKSTAPLNVFIAFTSSDAQARWKMLAKHFSALAPATRFVCDGVWRPIAAVLLNGKLHSLFVSTSGDFAGGAKIASIIAIKAFRGVTFTPDRRSLGAVLRRAVVPIAALGLAAAVSVTSPHWGGAMDLRAIAGEDTDVICAFVYETYGSHSGTIADQKRFLQDCRKSVGPTSR